MKATTRNKTVTTLTIAALVLFALASTRAHADPIAIFNSGVDAAGNVLAPANNDPHYQVTVSADAGFIAPGPAIVQLNHGAWLANDGAGGPGSSWISIVSAGTTAIAQGDYEFQTQFDLAGLDPATATMTAQVAVDNQMTDVRLNGNLLGIFREGFGGLLPSFTIDSGFVGGINTLDFLVNNAGDGTNPGGFRIVINNAEAAAIPEPASLMLLGLGSVMTLRRRRRGNRH
jgi:hypothetical protein